MRISHARSAVLALCTIAVATSCMVIAPLDDVQVASGKLSCTDGVKSAAETDVDCGGDCTPCADGKKCNKAEDCVSNSCLGSTCRPGSCSDGAKNGKETDTDCGGTDCPGCADGKSCHMGSDCTSGSCTNGKCAAPSCTDAVMNGTETAVDCGGSCPTKCKNGQGCKVLTDCQSGICEMGLCVQGTCSDLVQNGSETDVDCGGSCSACGAGKGCSSANDCQSKVCTSNTCAAATCSDSQQNGNETAVDCGGGTCPRCPDGQTCVKSTDCQSNLCVGSMCTPTDCTDGFKDGTETDADCGGACPKCAPGKICLSGKDCLSGVCIGSKCLATPSCTGGDPGASFDCGDGTQYCCDASVVQGGGYLRSYDAASYTDSSNPAFVPDFQLDIYEITVGRFREFVNGYPGTKPVAGAGANPAVPQSGWQGAWDTQLPTTVADLRAALKCSPQFETWTDIQGTTSEALPINCITWYEAFAFCAWDGGRLPTEAEWNFAASGGADQRVYPWSSPPSSTTIDDTYVVSGGKIGAVGSKVPGIARWLQADLAGNVAEWTLDWFGSYPLPCSNCANMQQGTFGRVIRGGSAFSQGMGEFAASFRDERAPESRLVGVGARCARSL